MFLIFDIAKTPEIKIRCESCEGDGNKPCEWCKGTGYYIIEYMSISDLMGFEYNKKIDVISK